MPRQSRTLRQVVKQAYGVEASAACNKTVSNIGEADVTGIEPRKDEVTHAKSESVRIGRKPKTPDALPPGQGQAVIA